METSTQSELESFRRQWREEVASRTKKQDEAATVRSSKPGASGPGRPSKNALPSMSGVQLVKDNHDGWDGELQTYHDLEDKEQLLKLGNDVPGARAAAKESEPRSALEHYERAVEREDQGSMGDSVNLYRKAYKLDSRVHEVYKAKHFPMSAATAKSQNPNPSDAPVTVPNPAHHSLEGPKPDVNSLIRNFSSLLIPPAEPETDLSEPPPCPIADVPDEVLVEILYMLALKDIASFGRLTRVCKRFAYLVVTEDGIWKRIVLGPEFGFAAMHYTYACDLRGYPILGLQLVDQEIPRGPTFRDLTPTVWPSYRSQFRHRPRIRFNGCYISTVNYTRPGIGDHSRFTWTNPIQIVTYYRYLRFFRDGSCISLLTTVEPSDVVHHLTKDNLHNHHSGGLPSSVMKDALKGRWRLSGTTVGATALLEEDALVKGPGEYAKEPLSSLEEEEGDVHVETEGVIPKYMWKMHFAMTSAGRREGTRNGKLAWKGFWSYNRLTDDWGEFGLKNDRAFYWSRVKSYGTGL